MHVCNFEKIRDDSLISISSPGRPPSLVFAYIYLHFFMRHSLIPIHGRRNLRTHIFNEEGDVWPKADLWKRRLLWIWGDEPSPTRYSSCQKPSLKVILNLWLNLSFVLPLDKDIALVRHQIHWNNSASNWRSMLKLHQDPSNITHPSNSPSTHSTNRPSQLGSPREVSLLQHSLHLGPREILPTVEQRSMKEIWKNGF